MKGKDKYMLQKRIAVSIGKIVLSGGLAFLVLTCFCYLYYNIPVHYATTDGVTDYKWESNVFYSRGTEGIAWGKTNNEGYTNMFDFSTGVQTDILIMGSSHMEAYQVAMNESTASRLNALFSDYFVYNIGVSGHNFLTCVCNLEAAINKYHPSKYVVIETGSISFSDEALEKAIEGTVAEIPSHTEGIVGLLQKNQYLRLLYAQMEGYKKKQATSGNEIENEVITTANPKEGNKILLGQLLEKISFIAEKGDTKLIIVYHPSIKVGTDTSLQLLGDRNAVSQFEGLCSKYGIYFLDMSDRFLQEYKDTYSLPYGFVNTSVGSGHLNKYGHAMIADELYKLISEAA